MAIIQTLLWKELRDALRDRRTLFLALVLPLLVQPLIRVILGELERSSTGTFIGTEHPSAVALWGIFPAPVGAALSGLGFDVVERRDLLPAEAQTEAENLIRSGRADAVIGIDSGAPEILAHDGNVTVSLWFDSYRARSDSVRSDVLLALDLVGKAEVDARFKRRGLPSAIDQPLQIRAHGIGGLSRGTAVVSQLLPTLLLVLIALAALFPTIESLAGEKERGTLTSLLCAPVLTSEIFAAKYSATFIVTWLAAGANVLAVLLAMGPHPLTNGLLTSPVMLTSFRWLCALLVLLAAGGLLCALLFLIVARARTLSEAQAYAAPLILGLLVPAFIAHLPGFDLNFAGALVPVLNITLVLRELLRGRLNPWLYATVLLSSVTYAAVAIRFAAQAFGRESALLARERPWKPGGARFRSQLTPTPSSAILFALMLIILVHDGTAWLSGARLGLIGSILSTKFLLFLFPALLWMKLSRVSVKETLLLHWPTARATAGIMLLTTGSFAVAQLLTWIETKIWTGSHGYLLQHAKQLGDLNAHLTAPWVLVLVGLLPSLVEEICFRGIVLSGLTNSGSRLLALGGSALFYAALPRSFSHPFYGVTMGVLLAYAALETGSLIAPLLIHAAVDTVGIIDWRLPSLERTFVSPLITGTGLAIASLGIVLLWGGRALRLNRPS